MGAAPGEGEEREILHLRAFANPRRTCACTPEGPTVFCQYRYVKCHKAMMLMDSPACRVVQAPRFRLPSARGVDAC